ncbi:MAG: hypothetical protein OXT67_09610 [Zetaproteobacteria bacterium]|nr:hypothetical protein [Zetaproteobacteria bacterium]
MKLYVYLVALTLSWLNITPSAFSGGIIPLEQAATPVDLGAEFQELRSTDITTERYDIESQQPQANTLTIQPNAEGPVLHFNKWRGIRNGLFIVSGTYLGSFLSVQIARWTSSSIATQVTASQIGAYLGATIPVVMTCADIYAHLPVTPTSRIIPTTR